MAYRVKKAFQKHPQLHTQLDGKTIALNEAYTRRTRGTPSQPPKDVLVPLATQVELKVLFERGEPCIEKADAEETKAFAKAKKETVEKADEKDTLTNEHEQ